MPRVSSLWLSLARRWDKAGRREDALSAYEEALTLAAASGEQIAVRLAYGDFLVGTGKAKAALEQRTSGARRLSATTASTGCWRRPTTRSSCLTRPRRRLRLRWRRPGPMTLLREWCTGNSLAHAYLKRGQPERALAIYWELVKEAPNDSFNHFNLASALDGQGRTDEAIEEYRTAERLAPPTLASGSRLAWCSPDRVSVKTPCRHSKRRW
jgi:tetratricopeptide (TPR) repeat protein